MRLHQVHSLTFLPAIILYHLLYYILFYYVPPRLRAAEITNGDLLLPGRRRHMQQAY